MSSETEHLESDLEGKALLKSTIMIARYHFVFSLGYGVVLVLFQSQIVEYEADEGGFRPRISVEPALARNGGYDENASDLARSDGPY